VAIKHVLKYLRVTLEYSLRYLGYGEVNMQGCLDLDWALNAADGKSTSGC
jgi:hypothetical protein